MLGVLLLCTITLLLSAAALACGHAPMCARERQLLFMRESTQLSWAF
jgi:hypothetical protein